MSRKYKLCRPYQLKEMIHSIQFNELKDSENFCLATARCNPSQSTNEDDIKSLFCVFDKGTGSPIGGFCSCTAGHSQSCGHIGALLFVLAEIISSGAAKLPADATCTDVPCYWTAPKGAAVGAKLTEDILITDKKSDKVRRTTSSYGKDLLASFPPPEAEDVQILRGDLLAAMQSIGCRLPAVDALHCSRFGFSEHGAAPTFLEEKVDGLDATLAPAALIEVHSSPTLPLALHPHFTTAAIDVTKRDERQKLIDALKFSKEDCQAIEVATRGQSAEIEWFHQRMGAITSTQASDISRIYLDGSKASRARLANRCLGQEYRKMRKPQNITIQSLRYGLDNENVARQAFCVSMSESHGNLYVEQVGMVVREDKPYLRASPDGMTVCDCHPRRLLEIKCPYAARDMTVDEAVKDGTIDYIDHDGANYHLHRDKRGYFCQVQMTMSLSGVNSCELVVWTKKQFVVLNVAFEPSYWAMIESVLDQFYCDYVLLAILGGPLADDKDEITSTPSDVGSHSQSQKTGKRKTTEPAGSCRSAGKPPGIKKNKVPHGNSSATTLCYNRRCRLEMSQSAAIKCSCHCFCSKTSCITCCGLPIEERLLWICNVCKKQCY